jgi:hypothetical protein
VEHHRGFFKAAAPIEVTYDIPGYNNEVDHNGRRMLGSRANLSQQATLKSGDSASSATAPLVCAKQPRPFVAVAWNPTCECTGNVTSDKLPCNACYTGRTLINYACRTYPNIVPLALLQGNLGKPSSCGPLNYEVACRDLDFGKYSNISVACAIDQTDPVCSSAEAVDLTRGVGTSAQPFGEKFLLLNWVQPGQPIMEHPGDALKLTSGSCPSTGSDNNKTLPPVFSGVWWTHGIKAIADQAELFFPAYKRAGGELDELVADWEAAMFGPQSCPLPDNITPAGLAAVLACVNCVRDKWRAIEADPRFPPMLTELQSLGFQMNGTLADTMIRYQCVASPDVALRPGGLADCSQLDGLGNSQRNMNAWHALIEQRQTDAWVRAILPAARESFPEVRFSLYNHFRWDSKFCFVPDITSARMTCAAGKGEADSLVSAPVYYDEWETFDCLHPHGAQGGVDAPDRCSANIGLSNTLQKLAKDSSTFELNFTGINIAKATINNFRQIALAANGTAVLAPWVSFKSFLFDYRCPGFGQPHDYHSSPGCPEPDGYWEERVLHYGLTGAARFYYFNVFFECIYSKRSTHEDDDAMSASLAELDLVIGCPAAERRWIPDSSLGWGSSFILSGMEVGSRRVAWRFTPSLPLQMDCITNGVPNNKTKWDPRVLVSYVYGSLTLGPLQIDHDGHLLDDCVIGFEHGAVLDVAGHSGTTTSATPFGLWIVQPISAAAPSVSCMAGHWHGRTPFEANWPLTASPQSDDVSRSAQLELHSKPVISDYDFPRTNRTRT